MKKGTNHFKEVIQQEMQRRADEDPLFAENFAKADKTIDECVNFIISEVQKSGAVGVTDDEVFNLAAHYYDEDNLKAATPKGCSVVINHKPELTPEELQELREQAKKEVIEQEKQRMKSKRKPSKPEPVKQESQSSLF